MVPGDAMISSSFEDRVFECRVVGDSPRDGANLRFIGAFNWSIDCPFVVPLFITLRRTSSFHLDSRRCCSFVVGLVSTAKNCSFVAAFWEEEMSPFAVVIVFEELVKDVADIVIVVVVVVVVVAVDETFLSDRQRGRHS